MEGKGKIYLAAVCVTFFFWHVHSQRRKTDPSSEMCAPPNYAFICNFKDKGEDPQEVTMIRIWTLGMLNINLSCLPF